MTQAHELPSLADAPGTLREYETIYILRPTTLNEGVADVNQRVRGIIEGMGGKVLKVDNWGKRRLAYEVRKERKGIYLYWQYLAGGSIVAELERNMRMLDPVIRYMTVKLDKDIVPDTRATEADDDMYERAANTAADEEDMYLTRPEGEGDGEDAVGDGGDSREDDDNKDSNKDDNKDSNKDDSKDSNKDDSKDSNKDDSKDSNKDDNDRGRGREDEE